MATLTADRHFVQRSLLDQEERYVTRAPRPRPLHIADAAAPRAPHAHAAAPAGPATLDDLVVGTWNALTVSHSAACIVCGGDLTPRWSSGPHPVAAHCRHCGSDFA